MQMGRTVASKIPRTSTGLRESLQTVPWNRSGLVYYARGRPLWVRSDGLTTVTRERGGRRGSSSTAHTRAGVQGHPASDGRRTAVGIPRVSRRVKIAPKVGTLPDSNGVYRYPVVIMTEGPRPKVQVWVVTCDQVIMEHCDM